MLNLTLNLMVLKLTISSIMVLKNVQFVEFYILATGFSIKIYQLEALLKDENQFSRQTFLSKVWVLP